MTRSRESRIPAGAFKAGCLKLMNQVARSRESLVITKHGRPIARLGPVDETPPPLFGWLAGSVRVVGDILGPLDEPWDVHGEPEVGGKPRAGS